MEQLERLLQSIKSSGITLDQQDLMDLSADMLLHARSILQLIVILVHESDQSDQGESSCHIKNLS